MRRNIFPKSVYNVNEAVFVVLTASEKERGKRVRKAPNNKEVNMRLKDKVVELSPLLRKVAIVACSLIIFAQFVWGTFYAMSKQVSIVDDKGEKISFITYASKTAEVLAEKNVSLGEWDEVSIPLDGRVKDGDTIYVYRSKVVTFINGKDRVSEITAKPTVKDFIESHGIDPESSIRTNVALNEKVTPDMTIQVTYLDEKTVAADEVLHYGTKKIANNTMVSGQTNLISKGTDGLVNRVYQEYYENGELVNREVVKETIKVAAVDEVVEYGTKSRNSIKYSGVNISRGNEYRYKDCLTVTATAYCCGTTTATGMKVRYGVVAVDPRVIPLGSRLYIEAENGTWIYGTAVAADTGGAIKGNKIDLYVESYSDAINFGRRKAKVYILE